MTVWNSTLPTLYAGLIPDGDDFTILADALHGVADAWTSYVPVWSATGTAPAVGNGSIVGAYKQVGKWVETRGLLTMGSTTTYGTGVWRFTLPVTALGTEYVGCAQLLDSGTQDKAGSCNTASTTLLQPCSSAGACASTTPHAWATNDQVRWHISYEAA